MTKIRHTKENARHYRMAGVEFPQGEREIDVEDEVAEEATNHKFVELVEQPEEPIASEEPTEDDVMDSTFYDGYTSEGE